MLDAKAKDIINTKITGYYDVNGAMCFEDKITEFKDTLMKETRQTALAARLKLTIRY